jgi:hypothetical protein
LSDNTKVISLTGHRNVTSLAFSSDGKRLGTVDADGLGRVWDSQTGSLLLKVPEKIIGIELDDRGDSIAVLGDQTRIHHFNELGNVPVAKIPNPAPKATTVVGGVGAVTLGLLFNVPRQEGAYWFTAQPPLGISLSKDGNRVAFMNRAPNLKGGYEVRLADAESGRALEACSLPLKFVPSGKLILSSDGSQVAVPGNGVYVFNFKTTNTWLAKPQKPLTQARQNRHELPSVLSLEPIPSKDSTSWLARAPHRRVSFQATTFTPENQTWVVPLGLGMKKVYTPDLPVTLVVNQSLKAAWQSCGHEVIHWDEELSIASRVSKWELQTSYGLMAGWELTAVIEIELTLFDSSGRALHSACYAGRDHQSRRSQPSDAVMSKMHACALAACLTEMKNDPQWQQVLGARSTVP